MSYGEYVAERHEYFTGSSSLWDEVYPGLYDKKPITH